MAVSTSIVLPPGSPLHHHHHHHHRRRVSLYPSPYLQNEIRPQSLFSFSTTAIYPFKSSSTRRIREIRCDFGGFDNRTGEEEEDDEGRNGNDKSDSELERALRLDGTIPGTSNEFVEQVSSRAYDMRRHLQQSFDSSSYDVLESNPWREDSKAVYVLTRRENELCTMKTRSNRSEVERELGQLFSKSRKLRNQAKKSPATKFQMLVEDIRDGVLVMHLLKVFEDETEAAKYCDLLQGGGQGCEGVAEIEASSVFDICRKMKALAVLFRRGRTPPLPENLKLNLRARKRSLEDQEEEESI